MNAVRIQRVLEPSERTAEVLFGLIMVLTFTGSLSVAEAGRTDIRAMLIGALGCNLAWGIIDGVLYLLNTFAEESPARTACDRLAGRARRVPAGVHVDTAGGRAIRHHSRRIDGVARVERRCRRHAVSGRHGVRPRD